MAHKTIVNGTVCEITGGKTIVDRTIYSIKSGKTIVGGTVYEVGFAQPMVTVNIMTNKCGVGTIVTDPEFAKVTIDGIVYDGSENVTLQVPIGTEFIAHSNSDGVVILNGVAVADEYTHIIQEPTTIMVAGFHLFKVTGRISIIEAPVVFLLNMNNALYCEFWAEANSTWNDIAGNSYPTFSNGTFTIINGAVCFVVNTSVHKIQMNGVDVKPTDTIEHLAEYSTITET